MEIALQIRLLLVVKGDDSYWVLKSHSAAVLQDLSAVAVTSVSINSPAAHAVALLQAVDLWGEPS